MNATILLVMILVLIMALCAVIAVSVYRERRYQTIVADLLDRVMARSYGEYVQGTKIAGPERARRRPYLDDAMLAEIERQARHEIGQVAVAQERR